MSNIYIQEPPTNGKVVLSTSVGDIDIELWSKEAPKACRNFVQLCLEDYYNNTIFHRVVKGFIVQGGDPTGTGEGGESIWGKTFKDEFHSRLRFTRRGLLAMANAGPHDNGSQFFFTMAEARELNNKHTIFGKVSGDTIYNMIKLEEIETNEEDRPLYPHKILKAKVLANPYDDIEPRIRSKPKDENAEGRKKKSKSKATKNFNLLSFGEEAEEDEEEVNEVTKTMRVKGKSSHDLLDDEKLSTVPAVEVDHSKEEPSESEDEEVKEERLENVRKKLRTDNTKEEVSVEAKEDSDSDEEAESSKLQELKKESQRLKRELLASRKQKQKVENPKNSDEEEDDDEKNETNELIADFKKQHKYYKEKTKTLKKGDRQSATLDMLAKFQTKMRTAQQLAEYESDDEEKAKTDKPEDRPTNEESDEEDYSGFNWMKGSLQFDEKTRKVLDANITDLDRYEIFDPRNPLNKRRREESKKTLAKKGKK